MDGRIGFIDLWLGRNATGGCVLSERTDLEMDPC